MNKLPQGCRMVDYSIPSDVRYQALTGHNVIRDPKLPQPIPAKAAPESEEEAFERAWDEYRSDDYEPGSRSAARHFWNARARLDAERGKP